MPVYAANESAQDGVVDTQHVQRRIRRIRPRIGGLEGFVEREELKVQGIIVVTSLLLPESIQRVRVVVYKITHDRLRDCRD